jgi:Tfp pilus assembly protein PilF
MAASNENADRRVVPRWRTFREALATNELSPTSIADAPAIDAAPFLRDKENSWLRNRTIPFAIDLVSASTVLGPSRHANAAAEMLLKAEAGINPTARALARNLLGVAEESIGEQAGAPDILAQISLLKRKRITQKKNAFIWTDLARLYVAVGQNDPAWRALRVALTLAPADRFVLRCTTRFLLHDHRAEEAFRLLQKAPRTREDPWLIAAELAVSSVLGRPPKFAKLGSEILKRGHLPPFHTSELASALASLEMFSGNDRKANRLFKSALVDPTDNALAQTIWASKRTGLGNIDLSSLENRRDLNEPRALDYFNRSDWEQSVDFAEAWACDESFSARPRLLASALATTFLSDPTRAEQIAREGLVTNPGHPGLINNIAFALIADEKPADALQVIETIDRNLMTSNEAICLLATTGLAYFRIGKKELGRELYDEAISAAFRHQNEPLRLLAQLYLAREEVLSGSPKAREQFQEACENAKKLESTSLPVIADQLAKQLEEEPAKA